MTKVGGRIIGRYVVKILFLAFFVFFFFFPPLNTLLHHKVSASSQRGKEESKFRCKLVYKRQCFALVPIKNSFP